MTETANMYEELLRYPTWTLEEIRGTLMPKTWYGSYKDKYEYKYKMPDGWTRTIYNSIHNVCVLGKDPIKLLVSLLNYTPCYILDKEYNHGARLIQYLYMFFQPVINVDAREFCGEKWKPVHVVSLMYLIIHYPRNIKYVHDINIYHVINDFLKLLERNDRYNDIPYVKRIGWSNLHEYPDELLKYDQLVPKIISLAVTTIKEREAKELSDKEAERIRQEEKATFIKHRRALKYYLQMFAQMPEKEVNNICKGMAQNGQCSILELQEYVKTHSSAYYPAHYHKQLYELFFVEPVIIGDLCSSCWLIKNEPDDYQWYQCSVHQPKTLIQPVPLIDEPDAATDQIGTCTVCFTNPVDSLLLPCYHCYCNSCCEKLTNYPCPRCRTPIESIKKIYL